MIPARPGNAQAGFFKRENFKDNSGFKNKPDDIPLRMAKMAYQEPSDHISSYRISDALCKENWTTREINSLMDHLDIFQKLDKIEDNLWYPRPMELFNFIFQQKITSELEDDIHYHLETLECARTIRLMKAMIQDPGMAMLKKLPRARLMNIFSHLAFSKTWIVPHDSQDKTNPQPDPNVITTSGTPNNIPFPIKQMNGDSSRNIILGNFPVRMKRSIKSGEESITLLFPNRTYPFSKVRVMAMDENHETIFNESFAIGSPWFRYAGSKFWSIRFDAPHASKYMLMVRPMDASECIEESNALHA